jgi:hypothetical protein
VSSLLAQTTEMQHAGNRDARPGTRPGRLAHALAPLLFAGFAVALVPWSAWLVIALPSRHVADHWDVAWAGFDIGLAAVLAATVVTAVRSSRWLHAAAASAATMLVCDAWFDVMTSGRSLGFWLALAEALAVELPLAAVCVWVAMDADSFAERTRTYVDLTRRVLRARSASGS